MQRDMDLVREILLRIEINPCGWTPQPFEFAIHRPEQVRYHAHIMLQDGLIESVEARHLERRNSEAQALSLTWKGHEFLDMARDLKRWNQAKAIIGKVGSAPFSVWLKVLHDLTLKDFGVAS